MNAVLDHEAESDHCYFMTTLYCTDSEMHNGRGHLAAIEFFGATVAPLDAWPVNRTFDYETAWCNRATREVKLAVKAALDWCWS